MAKIYGTPIGGGGTGTNTTLPPLLDNFRAKAKGNISKKGHGEAVNIIDSIESELNGLKLYGKSTQDGTPSPESPVPIVSAGASGSIETTITGKNLLTGRLYYGKYGYSIAYIQNETAVSLPYAPEGEQYGICYAVSVKKGVTYTFSVTNPNTNAKLLLALYRTFEDATDPNNAISHIENITSITPSEDGILVCLIASIWTDGITAIHECTASELLQLEIGSTATAYEAPHSQSITISTPNGLPGIPVDSGGNYTDADGQQWICDEVDFGMGTHTQRIGKISSYNSETVGNIWMSTTGQLTPGATVLYKLDNPIVSNLDTDMIADYKALTTYAPVTNIMTNSTPAAGIEIEYASTTMNVELSADKMLESRANKLAGAVWVYGDHEPTSVNDGTKIQLTREEVVTSDGGEAQTVTKTVEWNTEADFFARQFTYNSKKQYQTMLEGALASVIVEGAPAQVTDLVVSGSGGTATLTWVNPVDDPVYVETVVVQKVGSAPSDITDGTEIYRGTDQTCTATGLEQSTDYYFAVYTLNSLGIYGQPVVSDVYRYDLPAEPTEYLDCAEISETTEYEFPESGWFRIDAIAKSGDGGSTVQRSGNLVSTPGGGGTGGHSRSEIAANKGDIISIKIQNGDITISSETIENLNMSSSHGSNGIVAATASDDSRGGPGGTANGGNKINETGLTGRAGRNGRIQPGETYYGGLGAAKSIEINSSKTYRTAGGRGRGIRWSDGGYSEVNSTSGTAAKVFISRGNTNNPSPSTASTLSLLPTDSTLTVDWTNSGDPVQTGTMLVYNTNHAPMSENDGVSVDIPAAQAAATTFAVDREEQQADTKKQSYTITGLSNDKPVYVALFPYDANKKYGIPKTDVEIPRAHSWYDVQQELQAEVATVKSEMADYQEYYVTTQEVLK